MPTTNKPRLLYLSMYDPHTPVSGAGTRGYQFLSRLAESFDTDLVFMRGAGHKSNTNTDSRLSQFFGLPNLQSETAIAFTKRGYFLFDRAYFLAAARLMETHQYDWLICDYGLSAKYGLKLARKFDVPMIYSSHNVEYRLYLNKAKNGQWLRWPMTPHMLFYEKQMARKCDCLVAISESDADLYRSWTDPSKVMVIPQGFDESKFHTNYPPPTNSPRIVLFCGNLAITSNLEGVRYVVDHVVDPVVSRFPNTVFRFVGNAPPTDIRHRNVEFTGFLRDYPAALRQADVVISPVTLGQGFPTKIVEALACGKPIVSTETGARAIPPAFDNLHTVTLERFADTICDCLEHDQPVTSRHADRVAALYTWRKNIDRLANRMLGRKDGQTPAINGQSHVASTVPQLSDPVPAADAAPC